VSGVRRSSIVTKFNYASASWFSPPLFAFNFTFCPRADLCILPSPLHIYIVSIFKSSLFWMWDVNLLSTGVGFDFICMLSRRGFRGIVALVWNRSLDICNSNALKVFSVNCIRIHIDIVRNSRVCRLSLTLHVSIADGIP